MIKDSNLGFPVETVHTIILEYAILGDVKLWDLQGAERSFSTLDKIRVLLFPV